jgi:hypothetical protein
MRRSRVGTALATILLMVVASGATWETTAAGTR